MNPSKSEAIRIKRSCAHAHDSPFDAAASVPDQRERLPTLAIVDDDESDRTEMSRIFARFGKFRCVGVYPGAEDALREIPGMRPQLVLMDIRMPRISGIECTRRLRAAMPQLTIIVISGLQDQESMDSSRRAGADWYLVKPINAAQCLAVLIFKVQSRMTSTRRFNELQESSDRNSNSPDSGLALTARQHQVMDFLAKGFSCKEIPDQLGISYSAVHKHQVNSYRKLGAHNRTEAINKLWERNCL